jgi:hypothetical protein
MNWKRRPKPKSPSRESAGELVLQLFSVGDLIEEIERRELGRLRGIEWGPDRWQPGRAIVTCLDEAGVDESVRRDLVRLLRKTMDRCRCYIQAIGNDRRERGAGRAARWAAGTGGGAAMTTQSGDGSFRLEPLPTELWGVARMAREFQTSQSTIRRWARQGRIPRPCLRRQGRLYWDPASIDLHRRMRLRDIRS